MLLFILSFCMVFLSAYFLSCILNKERNALVLIYTIIFAFANIIVTMEFLSLFSAITQSGVLICNFSIFIISAALWVTNGRNLVFPNFKEFFKKFLTAIMLDKSLMILSVCFLLFLLSTVFMCIVFPVMNADAFAYHVVRSVFWISNKNLAHFPVADSRCLYFPINSELVYTWIFLFLKRQLFLSFPSFFGYVISIISTYKILDILKYSMRQRLWVIYILTSFAFVLVQASSTETDIINAGLVMSSIYMFMYGIKSHKEIPIVISALSYAIAIGVKTPSIFAIPMVAIGFTLFALYHLGKKEFYKPLLRFLGYGFVMFVIFSMYNYLQNFLDVGSIAGSKAFVIAHKNVEGVKAFPSIFIKHLFLLVDFTGFTWGNYLNKFVLGFRDFIISILGVFDAPNGINSSKYVVNQRLLEPLMGPGVLGILVLFPSWLISLIKPAFKRDYRTIILGFFGLMLVVNIAVLSYAIQFMTFSVRFLMFLTVISAPILIYSYKRKGLFKNLVVIFAIFYLTIIPTHLWARNIVNLFRAMKTGISISVARDIARCSGFSSANIKFNKEQYEQVPASGCYFETQFKKYFKSGTRVLLFANSADALLNFKLIEFEGYKIDTNLFENVDTIKFDDYDVIITTNNRQINKTFKKFLTGMSLPEGVNCIYRASNLTNSSKQYPYSAFCSIADDYFHKRGFDGLIKIKYSLFLLNSVDKSEGENSYPDASVYYKTQTFSSAKSTD